MQIDKAARDKALRAHARHRETLVEMEALETMALRVRCFQERNWYRDALNGTAMYDGRARSRHGIRRQIAQLRALRCAIEGLR